jgi:hypothetical protein
VQTTKRKWKTRKYMQPAKKTKGEKKEGKEVGRRHMFLSGTYNSDRLHGRPDRVY